MSVVINTNSGATSAANNLASSNAMLQRSLNRLSSGSKIVQPSDDAGGLAVSMKLQATINRTAAVNTNIQNAQSFLQTQDGALQTASKVLDRMSELAVLADDVTKNSSDVDNYNTEFTALKSQLGALHDQEFATILEATLEVIDLAVACRLRGFGGAGVMLSGGIDSAALAATAPPSPAARELVHHPQLVDQGGGISAERR